MQKEKVIQRVTRFNIVHTSTTEVPLYTSLKWGGYLDENKQKDF